LVFDNIQFYGITIIAKILLQSQLSFDPDGNLDECRTSSTENDKVKKSELPIKFKIGQGVITTKDDVKDLMVKD